METSNPQEYNHSIKGPIISRSLFLIFTAQLKQGVNYIHLGCHYRVIKEMIIIFILGLEGEVLHIDAI